MTDHVYRVQVVGVILEERQVDVTVNPDEPDLQQALRDAAELAYLRVTGRMKAEFYKITSTSAERIPEEDKP